MEKLELRAVDESALGSKGECRVEARDDVLI